MRWLFFGVLVCLAACSSGQKEQLSSKPRILTTISMISDLVKEVGGEHVEVSALICGELDPHTYELVKGDSEKFSRASLVFYNGLGLEHGYSLRKLLEKHPKAIALGNMLFQKHPDQILCIDGKLDPHIWMDISLWWQIVDPIVSALSELDPTHKNEFERNGEMLKKNMRDADHHFYTVLQSIPDEKRYLVTCHDAFHYFARRYLATSQELLSDQWKERTHAPEGLAPDAELCLKDIAAICDYIEKFDIDVLFAEANLNKDSLQKIISVSKEHGRTIRLSKKALFADSMGENTHYIEMISHNVNAIVEELSTYD